jgi:biopolymer transport protein ExbB/TolQ
MVVGLWPVLLTGIYAINKRKEKIAAQEQRQAVDTAVTEARAEADAQLKTALDKAAKDKESAIAKEVKKALEEAAKAAEEAAKAEKAADSPEQESDPSE